MMHAVHRTFAFLAAAAILPGAGLWQAPTSRPVPICILYADEGGLYTFDLSIGATHRLSREGSDGRSRRRVELYESDWLVSPAGNHVLAHGRSEGFEGEDPIEGIWSIAPHPEGLRRVVQWEGDDSPFGWDAAFTAEHELTLLHGAVRDSPSRILVLDVRTGELDRIVLPASETLQFSRFLPAACDANRVVLYGVEERVLFAVDRSDGAVEVLAELEGEDPYFAPCPSGLISFGKHDVRLWDAGTESWRVLLPGSPFGEAASPWYDRVELLEVSGERIVWHEPTAEEREAVELRFTALPGGAQRAVRLAVEGFRIRICSLCPCGDRILASVLDPQFDRWGYAVFDLEGELLHLCYPPTSGGAHGRLLCAPP